MFYVGLDIHSKVYAVCVLDAGGRVVQRARLRKLDQLLKLLANIDGPYELTFEASCGYGRWYELFTHYACRVVVAHPGQLRLIFRSKRKNDRVDAEKLARLLALNLIPSVHVPAADGRAWRELINYRSGLVGKRTRAKNEVRALLRSLGIPTPTKPGLWGKAGHEWLRSFQPLQRLSRLKLRQLVDEIESLSQSIKDVQLELATSFKDNIPVQQLRSIPGVGLRTAEAVVAFVDDPHRFANAKKLKERKKIALVATAHYLIRVMWSMLKNGTLWQEPVTNPTTSA